MRTASKLHAMANHLIHEATTIGAGKETGEGGGGGRDAQQ